MGEIAHKLLESYVKTCGVDISRMIRASVESRDWLRSPEPRQVRAVMRRVVEEITRTDKMVSGKKRMMRWWLLIKMSWTTARMLLQQYSKVILVIS